MFGQHKFESSESLSLGAVSEAVANLRDPSRSAEAAKVVAGLDLSVIARRLMTAPDGPKWDRETAAGAELRYRRFLLMTMLYPQTPFTPARDIDFFWHEHILNTRAYMRDCDALFGDYLHHDAGYGAEEKDFADKAVLDDQTSRIYTALFGEPYFASDVVDSAHCTVSACVEAMALSPDASLHRASSHCTVSACVEAVAPDALTNRASSHCTVSACVEAVAPTRNALAHRATSHCTVSACVEAKAGDAALQAGLNQRGSAHCTVSACVEAKAGGVGLQAGLNQRGSAHCTVSACVEARL